MNRRTITGVLLCIGFCFSTGYAAADSAATLFIYDKLDKKSSFYVTTFRDAFKAADRPFTECAVESTKVSDLSNYSTIVIYCRVMAFDMKSPVRTWLSEQKTLAGHKIHLFVTANRWLYDKTAEKLKTLIGEHKGTIVDAVSTATKDMTDQAKQEQVRAFVNKIDK